MSLPINHFAALNMASCTKHLTHTRDVQVRNRKARQATSSLKQPMLQSAYSEPPSWTLTRLVRSAVITLVSGIIAGQMSAGTHVNASHMSRSRLRAKGSKMPCSPPARAWHTGPYSPYTSTMHAKPISRLTPCLQLPEKCACSAVAALMLKMVPFIASLWHTSQQVVCLQACWVSAEA